MNHLSTLNKDSKDECRKKRKFLIPVFQKLRISCLTWDTPASILLKCEGGLSINVSKLKRKNIVRISGIMLT